MILRLCLFVSLLFSLSAAAQEGDAPPTTAAQPAAEATSSDAVSAFNSARGLLGEGQAEAALTPADTAVEKAPNWIEAYLLRGDIHLKIAGPKSEMQFLQDSLDEPYEDVDYEAIARSLKAAAADYEKAAELSRDGTQQRQLYVSAAELEARAQAADAVAKDLAAQAAKKKATEAAEQIKRKQDDAKSEAERAQRQKELAERNARQAYESELGNADRARGTAVNMTIIGSGLVGLGAALIYAGSDQAPGLGDARLQPWVLGAGALSALAGGLSLAAASPFGLTNLGPTPPRAMWPQTTAEEPLLTMTELLLGAGFGTTADVIAFLGVLALGGVDPGSFAGALVRTVVVAVLLGLDTALRPLAATFGANLGNEFKRDRDFRRALYMGIGVQGLAIASIALAILVPSAAVPLFFLGGLLHLVGVPVAINLGLHLDRDTYRAASQPAAPATTPASTPPSAPGIRLSF